MHFDLIKLLKFKKKSVVSFCAATGFFCACVCALSYAQERAGGDAPSRFMESIDQAEGVKRMAAFRSQRLDGDYCFRFELEHLPRRGKKITYSGTMWGSWNEEGPVTRIELKASAQSQEVGAVNDLIELIIQNGRAAKAWSRHGGQGAFEMIEGDALFEPVIPGITYSAFDLQMPFVYWDAFTYEGPGRVQSRVVQQFLVKPPAGSAAITDGIHSVRIGLDDAYDALLRVEILDADEVELSRFTVESFKKVQGQYIVKKITLKDNASKDRTRFRVKEASVGLLLDRSMFDACHATDPLRLSADLFKIL